MPLMRKMNAIKSCALLYVLFLNVFSLLDAEEKTRQELLEEESKSVLERSFRIAKQFYALEEGEEFKELTRSILENQETKEWIKQLIRTSGRRFFLFKYPSDGFQVKGYISFVPYAENNPLLIFLRGGSRTFGLMNPATDFTCAHNYTVIATTYRGGVSEGKDEFGGAEVNDIHNLMEYFSILQAKIGIRLSPKKTFILGVSRGGMEMFLALNRSPSLQHQVTKAVSLSGPLDLQEHIIYREDLKRTYIKDFGLQPQQNEKTWIAHRSPVANVSNLRKDLPILILQGTEDLRVSLNEGHHMTKVLERNGNLVTYLEIQGGNHCLANYPGRMNIITSWLEN
jgi:dipeptidyl aminopeptidase/acylaminoacyl peptidase